MVTIAQVTVNHDRKRILFHTLQAGDLGKLQILSSKNDDLDYDSGAYIVDFLKNSKHTHRKKVTPLQGAVALGYHQYCKQIIEEGITPDDFATDPPLLCTALNDCREDIVKLLIESGFDVNEAYGGIYPIRFAIISDDCSIELLSLVIDAGFPIDSPLDISGQSLLHYTVKLHNYPLVLYLLEYYANPNVVEKTGKTPLHCAVDLGDEYMAGLLCKRKAKPDIEDNFGFNPLLSAIFNELLEIMELLINFGADINYLTSNSSEPLMPLHLSTKLLSLKTFNVLIRKGADVNKTLPNGETALHIAANVRVEADNIKERTILGCMVYLLIKQGCNVRMRQVDGFTPLQLALKGKDVKLIKTLVSAGSELNDVLEDEGLQLTTFHLIAKLVDLDLINLCFQFGADSSAIGDNDIHPCHMALKTLLETPLTGTDYSMEATCIKARKLLMLFWKNKFPFDLTSKIFDSDWIKPESPTLVKTVKLLIEHQNALMQAVRKNDISTVLESVNMGAQVDFCHTTMRNPLHYIVTRGTDILLMLYLKLGVNLNYVDSNGETLLHKAARRKRGNGVQILLESGAVYNYTSTRCKKTALQVAESCGNKRAVNVLRCVDRFFNVLKKEKSVKRLHLEKSMYCAPVLKCCGHDGLTLCGKALQLGLREEAKCLIKLSGGCVSLYQALTLRLF